MCSYQYKTKEEIEEIIEQIGYTRYHFIIIILACLTFVFDGVCMSLMATLFLPIKEYYQASDFQIEMTSSFMFLLYALGAFFLVPLKKYFGSRTNYFRSIFILIVFINFSSLYTKNIYLFMITKSIIFFCFGSIDPMMNNVTLEYLPFRYRNFVATSIRNFYPIGQLYVFLLIKMFMPKLEAEYLNLVFLGFSAYSIFLTILFLLFFVDSPRNLIIEGKEEEGLEVFKKIVNVSECEWDESLKIGYLKYIKSGSNSLVANQSISSLFNSDYRFYTILLIVLSFCIFMLAFGAFFIFSKVLEMIDKENINRISFDGALTRFNNNTDFNSRNNGSVLDNDFGGSYINSLLSIYNNYGKSIRGDFDSSNNNNNNNGYHSYKDNNVTNNYLSTTKSHQDFYVDSKELASNDILHITILSVIIKCTYNFISSILAEIKCIGYKIPMLIVVFINLVLNLLIFFDFKFIKILILVNIGTAGQIGCFILTIGGIIYPTKIRDLAVSYFTAVAYVGSFISQFLFLWLLKFGIKVPYILLLVLITIVFICVILIPEPSLYKLDQNQELIHPHEKNISNSIKDTQISIKIEDDEKKALI